MQAPNPTRGHLAMLGFSIAIAGSFSLGVQIANLMDPIALMAARFLIAGLILGAAAVLGPGLRGRDFHAPWRYLITGGLFASYFVLMFEGLKTAPPVSAAAVFVLTPIMTALFGWVLLRQITSLRVAVALAIGATGALWVIFDANLQAFLEFRIGRGEAIYFVGCIAHALYIPVIRLLNRGEHPLVFSFGMTVAGFLLLTALSLPTLIAAPWLTFPPIFWIGLLYVSIFASAVSFFLLQYGAMNLPAARVMAYSYLTPSWVILWEWAQAHGLPNALALAGVGITVIAVAMLLRQD